MLHVTDEERRRRLGVRHALAPGHRRSSVAQAACAVVALHATEAASVHLAAWARTSGLDRGVMERALWDDRDPVKQLAMRRTVFAVPRGLLASVWGGPSARLAGPERRRFLHDLASAGISAEPERWLGGAQEQALAALASAPAGLTAAEVRAAVPALQVVVPSASGMGSAVSRVIRQLGLAGQVLRGDNAGDWRTNRPRWVLTADWLGVPPQTPDADTSYRDLVAAWLGRFGPGTESDLVWWLGATKTIVRRALTQLDAEEVRLDGGEPAWLLPDDLEEEQDPGPWVALLPALDPSAMGWRGRGFYLPEHREELFDRNGNAGTTAWVDGQVVGCWTQDERGAVHVHALRRLRPGAREALEDTAGRLTAWLEGTRVVSAVPSPAMRRAGAEP